MKILIGLALVLLTGCTCINFQKADMSGSYCSTKDIRGLDIQYDKAGVRIKLNSAINEIDKTLGVVAKGFAKGLTSSSGVGILNKLEAIK